jgi:hypothetical protein
MSRCSSPLLHPYCLLPLPHPFPCNYACWLLVLIWCGCGCGCWLLVLVLVRSHSLGVISERRLSRNSFNRSYRHAVSGHSDDNPVRVQRMATDWSLPADPMELQIFDGQAETPPLPSQDYTASLDRTPSQRAPKPSPRPSRKGVSSTITMPTPTTPVASNRSDGDQQLDPAMDRVVLRSTGLLPPPIFTGDVQPAPSALPSVPVADYHFQLKRSATNSTRSPDRDLSTTTQHNSLTRCELNLCFATRCVMS